VWIGRKTGMRQSEQRLSGDFDYRELRIHIEIDSNDSIRGFKNRIYIPAYRSGLSRCLALLDGSMVG